MELEIKKRQVGDVLVLDCLGEITHKGGGAMELRMAIRQALLDGNNQILLKLGGIRYIHSSGIGELVSGHKATREAGGELKLMSLTQKIEDLVAITKLLTIFDCHDYEDSALASFGQRG